MSQPFSLSPSSSSSSASASSASSSSSFPAFSPVYAFSAAASSSGVALRPASPIPPSPLLLLSLPANVLKTHELFLTTIQ